MTYQQTIDYLFTTLPMFSRMGSAAFKKDLTNIIALCEYLDNPHQKFKSVHIAGTNGKGSVSHMIAAVMQTAGYTTGLYTSPHLKDFRERIRVNGEMIAEEEVVQFVEKIKPAINSIEPSFFEITVAMAFYFFARQKVDIAIVEVGLGGRLDSTNIILPEVSVITNIGWDHMNMLGNSLEEIAAEKGGIIKEGIPVVVGEKNAATSLVFKKIAAKKNAPLYFAEDYFSVLHYQIHTTYLDVTVQNKEQNKTTNYQLDLPGIYQTKNILTVLEVMDILQHRGWNISDSSIEQALAQVKKLTGLHGRWEVIHEHPTVALEVAHNEDGVKQILAHLQQISYRQLHIIFGMVKDKPTDSILKLLPKEAHYYFTAAHIPRALDAATLQQSASAFGLKGTIYEDVNAALQQAIHTAIPDDLIIVCGSIFLVAEVDKEALQFKEQDEATNTV